jgi:hypothetical protein
MTERERHWNENRLWAKGHIVKTELEWNKSYALFPEWMLRKVLAIEASLYSRKYS